MSTTIVFSYNGNEILIQGNYKDKMKDLFEKFESKIGKNISKFYFIYGGENIKKDLVLEQIIQDSDKIRNKLNILVGEEESTIKSESNKIIDSKEVICPKCNENIFLKFRNYRINLINCKNEHNINNLSFEEYSNLQKIDLSKIICSKCEAKKSDTYNNEFYKCNTCSMDLCPLCKTIHDKNHIIINYSLKNYICQKHNLNYIKYCNKCKDNICMKCTKDHKNHDIIYFEELLPNEETLANEISEFRTNIDKFNNMLNDLIAKLNKVKDNIEIFYNMVNNSIQNYNIKYVNYHILKNLNEFLEYKDNILKELNNINNSNDFKKCNNIINIYNKMYNECNIYLDYKVERFNFEILRKLKQKNVIVIKERIEIKHKTKGKLNNNSFNNNSGNSFMNAGFGFGNTGYGNLINNMGMSMNNMNNMGIPMNNMNNMGIPMNNMNNMGMPMNNMGMSMYNMNNMGMSMNNNINQIFYMDKFYKNISDLLQKEFISCCEDQYLIHVGSKFELENNNLFIWKVTIQGPISTPYENGFFRIKVLFPNDFPKHGAKLTFINKIYHINVGTPEDPGSICYPPLNEWRNTGKVWKKANYNIKEALYDLLDFFYKPFDCVHDEEIGKKYYKERDKFNEECRKFVKLYASEPPSSFKKHIDFA